MKQHPLWKLRYNTAHYNYTLQRTPNVVKDGFYTTPPTPIVTKSNGLTTFIINFLNWSGSHGERTNNMGIPTVKKIPKMNIFSGKVEYRDGGMEWKKGNGKKGSSDVKGHVKTPKHKFPIPVYIEVKIGKDKMSDEQFKYKDIVTKTGALYCVVKNPEDWFKFYDKVVDL